MAVMTACQSTFTTLSLFLSVSLTRKLCCSCSLSACCTFPSHSSSSSIILSLSALLPFPSSQTLIATRLSKSPQQHLSHFAPPISPVCRFLFPFCVTLSPLFSVVNVPKPQIHSSLSVFLSHVCALSFFPLFFHLSLFTGVSSTMATFGPVDLIISFFLKKHTISSYICQM